MTLTNIKLSNNHAGSVKEGCCLIKEDLKRYVPLMREAEELRKRAEQLEDEARSLKAVVMDGMPKGTSVNDSIGNIVAKIDKLKTDYIQKYDLALCELYKIERVIESLESPIERMIMRKRYIEGKYWEDICFEMNYCWQHIHKIHARILKRLSK